MKKIFFVNILFIVLMPFMMYINVGNTIANFAISDLILVVLGLMFLININEVLQGKNWIYIIYFVGLLLSLLISQLIGSLNLEYVHASNSVMIMEMLKTIVVAAYFFSAVIFATNKRAITTILLTISFSSLPVVVIGMLSYFYRLLGKSFFISIYELEFGLRFSGTFEDPNLCALYFIMIFFISLLNYKTCESKILRINMLGISLVSVLVIALTLSRGGWLAFGGALLVLFLMNIKRYQKESVLGLFILLIFILLFFNVDYILFKGNNTINMANRIQSTFLEDAKENGRLQLMKAAVFIGNDNPIFGVGKGGFQLNSDRFIPEDSSQYNKHSIPHNTLLGFYSQQGIIGVIIFILLPGYILYRLLHNRKRQNDYFISLFVAFFLHSITINVENIRFIWYALGLMLATTINNIEIDFIENNKMQFRKYVVALSSIILLTLLLFINLSRYFAINIYVNKGNQYTKTVNVNNPGKYILSFDVQTDNSLNIVEMYADNELIDRIELKEAYGVVNEEVFIEDNLTIKFISNINGWMKINNAYLLNDEYKIPLYDYVLIPYTIEKVFNDHTNLIYLMTESFYKGIEVSSKHSDFFELQKTKIIQHSNLSNEFVFELQCKNETKIDYQLELLIDHNSISDLLPNENQRNYFFHRFTIYPLTNQWKKNNGYIIKSTGLLTLEDFELYGRYYDYNTKSYENEAYYLINYSMTYENQEIINTGYNPWINIRYNSDDDNNIHINNNGWVETGRIDLEPGNHTLTFTAQGGFYKDEYSKVRIRDSYLNIIDEIVLNSTMKEYNVNYHTDEHQGGISFILELMNHESEKDVGDRKVILQNTFFIE